MRTACIALALTLLAPPGTPAQGRSVQDFFRDFTAEWIRGNPSQAVATRFFTGEEQARFERQLTPETPAWRQSRVQLARRGLMELGRFDRARMTEVDRTSADILQWQLDTMVKSDPYADYTFPLEQFAGVNVNLVAILTVSHPMITDRDAANYVARLGLVGTRMGEAVADARRLAAKNMIPPRFILLATITQMKQFVGPLPADNPFVATFAERMKSIPTLTDAKRQELRSTAEQIVRDDVYPAWQRAIALVESLVPRSTDDAGLWRLPGGVEAYADALRRFTTTNLSADQIHEIGLRQVDQIEKEMDAILRQLGRTEGSVNSRIERLRTDLAYPLTEDGRRQIMADIDGMLRDAERRAEPLFDRRPKAPVVAQPFPRFREANAAASYTAPAPDGSRPGTFQIPLRVDYMTKFRLRSLVYHETVPGHHFQIALELENDAQPRFRRIRAFGGISAFSEGWGLYAEHLAAESGWYDGDLEGRLGQLDSELFRARRLVVDTGLHAKRWTRQQAIDYGLPAAEVERYVVIPGQACSYMVGQLKIIELRDRAKAGLGDRFSAKEFHNVVLSTGTAPLDVVERQIDAYVAARLNVN
ncbi:MAG: hypothetical protein A3G76_05580 [Acidobacteria bacterium RIFCSPLOWO2_12_FULL_65_11]|nr:MAG: hypothetical protein A3G76_05580 [Acidobacteria bacterium RIFCSPLOWO2_12_FULL_65_11]